MILKILKHLSAFHLVELHAGAEAGVIFDALRPLRTSL